MYSLLYHTTIIFPGATLGEVPVHAGVQSPVGSALIGEEPASPPPATPAQGLGSEVDSPVEAAPTPANFGLPPQQPVPNNLGLPPQPPPPPVGGVPFFQQNGALKRRTESRTLSFSYMMSSRAHGNILRMTIEIEKFLYFAFQQ